MILVPAKLPAEFDHPHINRRRTQCARIGLDENSSFLRQFAIKHQIRKLMFEDALEQAEAAARAESIRGQTGEETRPLVPSASDPFRYVTINIA